MQRAEGWPDAVSLDPSSDIASPVFEEALRSWAATPVILLAAGPQAQRSGWAAETAVALADRLASSGQRVVLADLSLDRPELHERVGTENTEGLTDVFLFGASLEHVTRMLPAHSFELIPAAPFTPDSEEILTHRRWSVVFEELAATRTRLLLYLPITVDGTGALSDRVGHTVVLAHRTEAEDVRAALSADAEIMGFFAPVEPAADATEPSAVKNRDTAAAAATPRLDDGEFEKIRIPKNSAREALIADLRARQRAALMEPAPAITPLPDEVDVPRVRPAAPPPRVGSGFPPAPPALGEPTFAPTARAEKPRRRVLLPALLVTLLVSSAAAGWHMWNDGWAIRGNDGLPSDNAAVATTAPNQAPAPPAEPPMPAGRPLPYSVAIAIYQLPEQAQERVDELRRDERSMQFYIAPTLVQGSLFYRVMAGPLSDSVSAVAVRDTLMARRIKTFTSASDLLAAPYAFLLGSFERRNQAEARVEDVAARGIPAYIVPMRDSAGVAQYRVYAGAYTGPGDAQFLRDILKAAGLPDSLVERTGSIRS